MSSLLPLSWSTVLLAAAPILLVLYLMTGRQWGGSRAGPAGWLAAVLIALFFFGANGRLLLVATGRAVLLSLFVLYIIWMALLLYHVVNEAGGIAAIGRQLPGLAPDRPGQALLLAWIFGSFLQGASGFGVPAAVVAPLLAGLGFEANVAVVMALLGHGWAVTFGSLGSSFISLVAAAGLPGELYAGEAALLLGVCCLGCGLGVLWTAGGWAAVRSRGLFLVALTLVMGGVQWGLATAGLWTLAAFGAGLVGLGVALLAFHYVPRIQRPGVAANSSVNWPELRQALFPYLLLIVVIATGQLLLARPLDAVQINFDFPAVSTAYGWETPAGPGRSISVFGHAGALLFYASLLSFLWFRRRGPLGPELVYSGRVIARKTVRGSVRTTISVFTLVAMAVTMEHAGMTQLLAETLSSTGRLFPFLSPFIGALGSFMTGSNTNSNVVFGLLQRQTAETLGVATAIILAAQTAGGAVGSVFAPAKVVVGSSTVAGANDGRVLKLAAVYGVAITVVVGLLSWWWT